MLYSDRFDTQCPECYNGRYIEKSLRDDIERTLHCSNCDARVDRYFNVGSDPEIENRMMLAE